MQLLWPPSPHTLPPGQASCHHPLSSTPFPPQPNTSFFAAPNIMNFKFGREVSEAQPQGAS